MNPNNEQSPRMNRIRIVSKAIRLAAQYGLPLLVVLFLAIALGALKGVSGLVGIAAGGSIPRPVNPYLPIGQLVLFLIWYRTIIRLFRTFEKGFLFTAGTVRCVYILGSLSIAGWLLELGVEIAFASPETRVLTAGLSGLLSGLFIFFLGWLLDEARRLQEEQALTI